MYIIIYTRTYAYARVGKMGYFASIEKKDIIAVVPADKINPRYLSDSKDNKYFCSPSASIRSVVICAKSGGTVCYGTKLSAKTLEKKLNNNFFLNI